MGIVTLPKLSQTGTNEWADVEDNDVALRDEINGSLDSANLAADAVGTTQIANSAVTTAKIADDAVTRGKIPDTFIQTKRVTTGSVTATGEKNVAVTWDTSFGDTDYTVVALVHETMTNEVNLRVLKAVTISATAVTVTIKNDAGSARTGTIHLIGIHD